MKVFSLLSTAALTTCLTASGFCEEENPARMDFRESQHEMILSHQTRNGYNNTQDYSSSSSKQMMNNQNGNRVMDSSHGCVDEGFSFEAEFLWWRAVLDNLEYAATLSGRTGGDDDQGAFNRAGHYKHPSFKFDPGARLSAGYDFGMSNWDVFARWTYHYTAPTDSTFSAGEFNEGEGSIVLPLREFYDGQGIQLLTIARSGVAKWQNQINVADLEMGYDYFFSDRFSFRPSFGLKASWINMEFNTHYTNASIEVDDGNDNNILFRNKSDWWGVGPAVGMDGHLHMGWGFSLYGRVSGALMYGCYDTRYRQTDFIDNNLQIKANDEYRQRAMSQVVIGLEWAHCFSNSVLLAFNLGWEGQYWWNQHEMRIVHDTQPSGDLTFTGLDAGIRLDF